MMEEILLALLLLVSASSAQAQSATNFHSQTGQAISSSAVDSAFAGKQDVNGDSSGQHVTIPGAPSGATSPTLAVASSRLALVPDDFRQPADGADDAPSIQRAITQLCAGSGGELDLLARHYAIYTGIQQQCPVIWQGRGWQEAPAVIASAQGTWLDVMTTSVSPVTISTQGAKGSEVRDIAVDQPGQPAPPASGTWTPGAYQYVFDVEQVGGYVGFRHLFMDGVTDGIKSFNGGRTVVDGLWGQFFNNAVLYDQETDVSRVEEVHDWPFWSAALPVIDYQQAHHIGVICGRCDSPFLDRIFFFAAAAGVQFAPGAQEVNGVYPTTTGFEIGSIQCDSVVACISAVGTGVRGQIANLTTFGQKEIASGVPYPGATAIRIDGLAFLQIGNLHAGAIDQAMVTETSTTQCSNVQIGSANPDFSLSTQTSVSLLSAVPCGTSGAKANLSIGMNPTTVLAAGQTLTDSAGGGATVYLPTVTAN